MIKFFKNKSNLLLLLILCLAAFLRLYRIQDYMTFLGDEGRDVLTVYNILHGHLTLLGPTSSVGGFFLGPIYYYFMAPFLFLFNYDPVGPAVMVALFGVATVWLVYRVGKEFFGEAIGLMSAFLYSISPLVILYSHSSWNPNLMPFFSLATLYCSYLGIKNKSFKFLLLAGICLGIAMQLHYLSTFLAVICAGYIFTSELFINKKNATAIVIILKDYLLFGSGFIVGFSPFLAFELRHGFANIRSILNFIFHSGDTGGGNQLLPTVYDIYFRIFGRLLANYPVTDKLDQYSKSVLSYWTIFILIIGILSSILLIYSLFKNKKNPHNFIRINLLFIWFILGIILFGFYKKSIYDYYLAFLFPLPFLLLGNLIVYLWRLKWGKIITIILLIVLSLLNSLGWLFWYPANRQLLQAERISRFVLDQTGDKPFNFALITGGNSDHAYRYFFTIWQHPPVTIQNAIVDPKRTTVTDQLLIVCESTPCHPLGDSLWEVAGFGRAETVGYWRVSVVEVYKLVHYKGK